MRAPLIDGILKIRSLKIEAIKAFLLQHGVSVPLKKSTICFLLDQMQALKSKPEIASLGLKI
jgi:hypothetical protein